MNVLKFPLLENTIGKYFRQDVCVCVHIFAYHNL